MLASVYKGSKLQLVYNVEGVDNEPASRMRLWRNEMYDEVDPEDTAFDLYMQSLLMLFEPAICVTASSCGLSGDSYLWFEWGCLMVKPDGKARLYIDPEIRGIEVHIC